MSTTDLSQFYINGRWVAPSGRDTLDIVNPATEESVAVLAMGDASDVDTAVAAAKARAGDAAVSITRLAIHLHGAMGFTDDCDIGLFMKRAVALNATLGQPEELRLQFVARERAAA